MSTLARVARGVPAGGQFTTGSRGEPDVVLFELDSAGDPAPPRVLHSIGFNDEQTSCDRCGRVELRGTVVLADDDGVEVARMGTSCATQATGRPVTRSSALKREVVRRSVVHQALSAAANLLERGRFCEAATYLDDARREGMHLPGEVRAHGQYRDAVARGLAARTERWAVVAHPGKDPVEVDTPAEAHAAAAVYARRGGYAVHLDHHGQWVTTPADAA